MTKGEVLRYAIAFTLRRSRKIIRGLKEGMTEEERFAVADHAVAQLKQRGDPWRLNEETPRLLSVKPRALRRHYRSRHSGLIKFSNRLVYDDDLIVFPSATELMARMGVEYRRVEGRYKAGTNP